MQFNTPRRVTQLLFIFLLTLLSFTMCWANTQEEATELIEQSVALLTVKMAAPQFEGVRNLVGASRAVVIVPNYKHGGLMLGYGRGTGIVLKRHGKRWSDPLFVTLSEIDLGIQVGFQQASILAFVLTENAVNNIAASVAHWGTSGGISFLKWGLDASGTASWDSGLDSTVVALSKGLYFGATFNRAKVRPNRELIQFLYGDEMSPSILAAPGTHPAAAELRNTLKIMLEEIWQY